MTIRDLVEISLGNLWRMKLRAFLTISGVVIAIAAFVAMLSFGAGNQQFVETQFNDLGLFHTMQVYPEPDSSEAVLDQAAIEALAQIPGVNLAYPLDDFDVMVSLGDTTFASSAQALSAAAAGTPIYSGMLAGSAIDSDSSGQVIVDQTILEAAGVESPDSALGRQIIVTTHLSTLDSGLAAVVRDEDRSRHERLSRIEFDSLFNRDYVKRLARTELSDAAQLFFDGYMNNRATVSDTLTICGVIKKRERGRARIRPILLTTKTALRLNTGGLGSNPTDLITALNSGQLFGQVSDGDDRAFTQVTLDLANDAPYAPIKDSVKALGFRAFSYAEEFEEIRRFFIYFDMSLGVIGLIALITAALGIINTMVMSILERTREIGIMKSLGAGVGDIRLLFLVESGVIGALGASFGIILGWLISRLASAIFQAVMASEGIDQIDLFALPWWLVMIAFGFGLGVSVLAGLYPAARAARVDPVRALRAD
ncbi:MAG: FtsX-like permease family protein [bacterium]